MNISTLRRGDMGAAFSNIALVLVASVLMWSLGVPTFLSYAKAASLTSVSDTLTDSAPSHLSKHTINFTTSTTTLSGETIIIAFDPITSGFSETFSTATSTDITGTGLTVVNDNFACPGSGDSVYPIGNYNGGSNENITFTVCPSNSLTAGAKTITIGAASTKLITNPSGTGSYRITIAGTMADSGETRVAIINNVVLTASVDTSFTFTVSGLATSTSINGTSTTKSSTATGLSFGTLAPGVPASAAQQLTVSTNARNGFVVTVQENQPPTSSTGATIDLFKDGATTSSPVVWAAPTGTLDQQWTYGHIGLTSDDADLNSGEFSGTKFAGNFDQPRQVFSHTGPADGTTQNKGLAKVGYEIQITALQEAGTDYTNTLTYVATPTF